MASKAEKSDRYRSTLRLPKTDFPMKANLIEREPAIQRHWLETDLEGAISKDTQSLEPFVFHDGPPYANGPIHLGHLLNKVLKDMVVRSRRMMGYRVEFVPGWDCHGLPIEHRVMKDLGKEARDLSTLQIRQRCRDYAARFVDIQAEQMKRLGTSARYDDPYITMDSRYEAGVLEVFRDLLREGVIYRALKPVHWSLTNRTALAEAELEYQDRTDTSIFVMFDLENPAELPATLNCPEGAPATLMVWTTTPWTLPANLAVVVAPKGEYGLYRFMHGGETRLAVVATDLEADVFGKAGIQERERLGICGGQTLADAMLRYHHPFIERAGVVSFADYVTTDDGTGLVHTAPGHGQEDYETGLRLGLDIYCPVLGDGRYDQTVPDWLVGQNIWKANPVIVEHLRGSGHLFFDEQFEHSYPHDWRSKTPTIFRATEQWFIAVDKPLASGDRSLRELGLNAVETGVSFVPEWGANRLRGMVESRPDWCISRQRSWGLPIPAFVCEGEETLLTDRTVSLVLEQIKELGSDAWFERSPAELLGDYDPADDPDAPQWLCKGWPDSLKRLEKSGDIFDVWFESGSSWNAVLRQREVGYPAELYLEGSDQHRGWFQLSLLPGLGATGQSPFKALLTHGFMVDSQGRKMSKSSGNALEVDTVLKQYGADIARWWVSSLNYANDIKIDPSFFRSAADEYRKVRNTLRFVLGNLGDFDPDRDRVALGEDDETSIDAWARQQLSGLVRAAEEGYRSYQFKRVNEAIFNFCNDTMSAVYLSTLKDRIYCNAVDSRERRRAQSVLFEIAETLLRLLAPILVHTAEEAWQTLKGSVDSIHRQRFSSPPQISDDPRWDSVMTLRHEVSKALERAKDDIGLKNPLDAGVHAVVSEDVYRDVRPFTAELADLTGVSRFSLEAGVPKIGVHDLRDEPRCERSWKRDGTVSARSDGGWLTDRDAAVLGV
ncbi:MAG: isoleucine--tRNA ligase [Myxococcota bacterium]